MAELDFGSSMAAEIGETFTKLSEIPTLTKLNLSHRYGEGWDEHREAEGMLGALPEGRLSFG